MFFHTLLIRWLIRCGLSGPLVVNEIHIPALSETRFAEVWNIKKAGFTLLWSGRKGEEKREAGAGFPINISAELLGTLL